MSGENRVCTNVYEDLPDSLTSVSAFVCAVSSDCALDIGANAPHHFVETTLGNVSHSLNCKKYGLPIEGRADNAEQAVCDAPDVTAIDRPPSFCLLCLSSRIKA
jgi:hypothetical protein